MFLCNNAACPVKFTSHVFLRDELEASISEFKQSENYVNIQTSKFEDVVSKIEHFIRTVKLSKTNQVCVHLPIYVGRSNHCFFLSKLSQISENVCAPDTLVIISLF